MGQFPSPHFRRPVRPLADAQIAQIRQALDPLGLLPSYTRPPADVSAGRAVSVPAIPS